MSPLFEKVAVGVIASTLVGGGTAVLTNLHTNAVQSEKISNLETRQDKTDLLIDKLEETNIKVELLNQKLDFLDPEHSE